MMRAVLDDMKNYPVYFCMFQRRFFVLLCFFFALLLCVPAQGLSANPPDYERAKAQLERLHHGRHSAAEWQACADAFRRAYERNPKWRLRVAALYRQGVALEGRARVTRASHDARRALSTLEIGVLSSLDDLPRDKSGAYLGAVEFTKELAAAIDGDVEFSRASLSPTPNCGWSFHFGRH